MRRFTPLRIGFLGVLTSFALLLGMLAFPTVASAHTASAQTPASTQSANWGCGGFDEFGDCGFDRFGGCGGFGFNDEGFDCGGGFGFNDCGFGFGGFGFRHHFFRHHFFRHHFF